MDNKGKKVMTQAQEMAELRTWLRQDIGKLHERLDRRDERLHNKIDEHMKQNEDQHKEIREDVAELGKYSAVNKAKLVGLTSSISLIVAGFVASAFSHFSGS